MRLIFSLASHYKPKSVSHIANQAMKQTPGAPIKKETTAADFSHAWQAVDRYLKSGFSMNRVQAAAIARYSTWDVKRTPRYVIQNVNFALDNSLKASLYYDLNINITCIRRDIASILTFNYKRLYKIYICNLRFLEYRMIQRLLSEMTSY